MRAFVLGALIAILVTGCGGGDDATAPEATPIDAALLLERAAERMDGVTAFRFELDHENGSSEIVQGVQMERASGAVAGPDHLEVEVEGNFLGLNVDIGVVILPDDSYLRNPITGNWEREQLSVEAFFDPASGVTALMRSVRGAEVAGNETIDGVSVVKLEATIASEDLTLFGDSTLIGETVRAAVWIGLDDPLVYRLELTGPVLAGDGDDVKRRLVLSDFDGEIVIEAPR